MKKQHKIAANKIVQITNGVEINDFITNSTLREKIRNEFAVNADYRLVGFIGRLTWQKGLAYFLRAIKEIEDTEPLLLSKLKYLIVGEGELEKQLKELANNLGLAEKIIFSGFRKDTQAILSAIDILVLPSLREGQPIILLEAMSMEKTIITSGIEGINEIIVNNLNGITIPSKDGHALAGAIVYLIKNDSLAQKLGKEARQTCIDKFNIDNKVREHERLYESVVGSTNPSVP